MRYTYLVPRNTTKLTTRGGTSPDGVEMTLIRERKSTHRLHGDEARHRVLYVLQDARRHNLERVPSALSISTYRVAVHG